MGRRRSSTALAACAVLLGLAACGGGGTSTPAIPPADTGLSAEATLGEKIFHDTSLSASGAQSCATCHVAASGLTRERENP